MKAATSGVRTLAYILDTVFIFIAMVVFVFFLVALTDAAGARKTAGGIAALLVMFVGLLLPYCYFGYLDGVRGGSWGKQIFGLRVIHAATGQPIGFWKAVLRLLVLVLTNWIFCACALSILFDSSGRKRGWHDQAAEACVVQN
ncbi:RDD family protein [Austwickia chelonae]|nr:RDD family protein [Austwickia chelonae]